MIRKFMFNYLFSEKEKTAIMNALFRRQDDLSTKDIKGDKYVRDTCGEIAREIFCL